MVQASARLRALSTAAARRYTCARQASALGHTVCSRPLVHDATQSAINTGIGCACYPLRTVWLYGANGALLRRVSRAPRRVYAQSLCVSQYSVSVICASRVPSYSTVSTLCRLPTRRTAVPFSTFQGDPFHEVSGHHATRPRERVEIVCVVRHRSERLDAREQGSKIGPRAGLS
jgi:hypothetical protein